MVSPGSLDLSLEYEYGGRIGDMKLVWYKICVNG
jgi:hypothetical protein